MKKLTFLIAMTGALLLAGCTLFAPEEFTMDPPAVDSGTADFTTYVALGNSLTAGYQSGALYQSTQQYGWAMQLADAMGVGTFEVPWISDPGVYDADLRLGHLQVVFDAEGNAGLAPVPWSDDILDASQLLANPLAIPYHNLGVPGSTAYDLFLATNSMDCFTAVGLGEPNAYFDMILRNAMIDWTDLGGSAADLTAVEQAIYANPTFASVWIGNNELLLPATSGIGAPFYPAQDEDPLQPDFESFYTGILGTLVQSLPEAKFVTADLPYVTNIPFFTTVPWFVVDPESNPVDADGNPDNGIQLVGLLSEDAGGMLTDQDLVCLSILSYDSEPNGVPDLNEGMGILDDILIGLLMSQGMTQEEAIAALPVAFPHHGELIPGALTLVDAEKDAIIAATDAYNTVIHAVAGGLGVPVVEVNDYFQEVAAEGAVFNGEEYTTEFVTGGLFSLDGVHPSNIGYALITAKFIETINDAYGSNLMAPTLPTVPMRAPAIQGLPKLPAVFPGMPY